MRWDPYAYSFRLPRLSCPRPFCPSLKLSPDLRRVVRKGPYFRKSTHQHIQRYFCHDCQRGFSGATSQPCFGQKKRYLNTAVGKLLTTTVSHRGAARLLGVNRKTIATKRSFLAKQALAELERQRLEFIREENGGMLFQSLQMDELETIEHTRKKPISVPLVVDARTRFIVDIAAGSMPAKGTLAKASRAQYGRRKNERKSAILALFQRIRPFVDPKNLRIKSDSCPLYPALIQKIFPHAKHDTVISRQSSLGGQGELKRIGKDPLFSINHTCAMLRAQISRLIRKTWCTTKEIEALREHLILYAVSHNRRILAKLRKKRMKGQSL